MKNKVLAILLCTILVLGLSGCSKNSDAKKYGKEIKATGEYKEEIQDFNTGNEKIDNDLKNRLLELSEQYRSGFMPEGGDYTFNPEINSNEINDYINIVVNTARTDEKDRFYVFVYNIKSGELAELNDILNEKDYNGLSEMIIQSIKDDNVYKEADLDSQEFKENILKFSGFALESDHLALYYLPNTILPGVFDTPIIRIPYSSLSTKINIK